MRTSELLRQLGAALDAGKGAASRDIKIEISRIVVSGMAHFGGNCRDSSSYALSRKRFLKMVSIVPMIIYQYPFKYMIRCPPDPIAMKRNQSFHHEIIKCIYIYIYAPPPPRSMDFRLLGRGRLRVFSNYLIQKSCQHENSLIWLLV